MSVLPRQAGRRFGVVAAVLSSAAFVAMGPSSSQAATVRTAQPMSASMEGTALEPAGAAAAYDDTLDRFLVAWSAPQELSSTTAVWGRFMTPDGVPSGRPFRLAVVGSGIEGRHAEAVKLVFLPALRRYLAVFSGPRNASFPQEREAYGQWLDDQGDPIGGTIAISRGSVGTIDELHVAADPEGTAAAVVYRAQRLSRPQPVVVAQIISPGAISLASEVLPSDGVSEAPSVAFAPGIERFVVTGVRRSGEGAGEVVLVPIDGTPPAGLVPIVLATVAPGTAVSTAVSAGTDGMPRVAWAEGDGAGFALRLVQVGSSGPGTPRVLASGPLAAGVPVPTVDLSADPRTDRTVAAWNVLGEGTRLLEVGGDGGGFGDTTLAAPEAVAQSGGIGGTVALDRLRGGWLLPWSVSSATPRPARQVFARPVDPSPAVVVPAGPAPRAAPPAPNLCVEPLQPFLAGGRVECGGIPVPAFQVATVSRQRRSRLLGLVVSPTSGRERVRVTCVSRCTGRRATLKRKGRKRSTSVPFTGWRTAPPTRATIEVRLEIPGRTTRFRRFRVVSAHPRLVASSAGCILPTGRTASC